MERVVWYIYGFRIDCAKEWDSSGALNLHTVVGEDVFKVVNVLSVEKCVEATFVADDDEGDGEFCADAWLCVIWHVSRFCEVEAVRRCSGEDVAQRVRAHQVRVGE